jgi:hypothetical protein
MAKYNQMMKNPNRFFLYCLQNYKMFSSSVETKFHFLFISDKYKFEFTTENGEFTEWGFSKI